MMWRIYSSVLVSMLGFATAQAQPLPLGPHEHGVGQLNVTLSGNDLRIELLAPAGDIVGFEHTPVTVKERMAVRRVAAQLARGERLFALPGAAACVLSGSEVDGEQMAGSSHDHGHAHGTSQPASGPHAHAEYHAIHHFRCRLPQSLRVLPVALFDAFPRLTRLRFNLARDGKQRSGELTPAAASLSLTP